MLYKKKKIKNIRRFTHYNLPFVISTCNFRSISKIVPTSYFFFQFFFPPNSSLKYIANIKLLSISAMWEVNKYNCMFFLKGFLFLENVGSNKTHLRVETVSSNLSSNSPLRMYY